MWNIVIDMGGTRLKIGLFNNDRLTDYTVVPTCSDQNFGNTLQILDKEIQKLLQENSLSSVDKIGLAIPGIVDSKNNKVLSINEKYNDSTQYDLNQWAENTWKAKLVTENDARAALAGEWQNGAGKGTDNLVMMTLGTGIGGAALIEGKLLHGKHYQAGCLGGHFCIDFQGKRCNCGSLGCVETKGSSWILPSLADDLGYPGEGINFKKLFEAYNNGDEGAGKVLGVCMDAWSACAINLIHAYDPEMLIIGGGVMKSGSVVLPHIQAWVDTYAWTPWGKVKVIPAELEDTAALYGMNYLLMN